MPSLPHGYLETDILTAPPHKLHLMMVEAAIRFARRAHDRFDAGEDEEAGELLIRSQRIVTELINGLDRERSPELVKKITSIYLFILRSLTESSLYRDLGKLDDAIRVLDIQRETWRQLCGQVGRSDASENGAAAVMASSAAPLGGLAESPLLPSASDPTLNVERFSLDA